MFEEVLEEEIEEIEETPDEEDMMSYAEWVKEMMYITKDWCE